MASGVLGVQAFPKRSVCVIKSGTGAAPSLVTGVLSTPGDLKSVDPRTPAGVDVLLGVEAAVKGVSTSFDAFGVAAVSTVSAGLLRFILPELFPLPSPVCAMPLDSGKMRSRRFLEGSFVFSVYVILWFLRRALSVDGFSGVGAVVSTINQMIIGSVDRANKQPLSENHEPRYRYENSASVKVHVVASSETNEGCRRFFPSHFNEKRTARNLGQAAK